MRGNEPQRTPPDFPSQIFATRITGRSPQWKLHETSRAARGALAVRRWYGFGEVWQLDPTNGEWYLIEERSYDRGR